MRIDRLVSILVLATVGCSASGDDMDLLDPPNGTERPRAVADELTDDLDVVENGGGYGIILVDTTNSMNSIRPSTGNTRCEDAKTMARGMINDFFDPTQYDGDGIAIWGFTNDPSASDDVQPIITGYYNDALSAKNAVNTLSCQGSSPLADALCKGVNGDGETFTINPMLDYLFILTDGVETNSDGACAGPSGSPTTTGTWQYNVLQAMLNTGIRVDTRYWVNPTILDNPISIDSFAAADDEPYDPSLEELQLVADIEELPQAKLDQLMAANDPAASDTDAKCDVTCNELALFEQLAKISGGTWGVVTDDDASYPLEDTVDPVTGPVHPVDTESPATPVGEAGS
jgi:Mg-chelatase subunit ChlD